MNIWLKSLLVGVIAAILAFLLSERLNNWKDGKKYSISYIIKAEPDTNSIYPFSLPKIVELLKRRIEIAEYRNKIESLDNNTIRVSLFEMLDTLSPGLILTSNGSVQFRELYNIGELSQMLSAAINIVTETNATLLKENDIPTKRDSMSKEISDLLDSMKFNREKQVAASQTLIEFSTPYQNEAGLAVYPAEIGAVKLKDTAAVRKIFQADTVKRLSPADMQLCFGKAERKRSIKNKDQQLLLYFLKTKDSPEKALLENEDISEAIQDFDRDGKVEIRLQFNRIGTRKWAAMTKQNIGRSIAIIINGTVVSAPTVLGSIEEGTSSISGYFTVQEAQALCVDLKSKKLPSTLRITSEDIKPEKSSGTIRKKLLITLITFLVFYGLAFFTFKTLKPT